MNATTVEQPLPTAEDLARPFLQGILALHEIANYEPCVDMGTAEKEGTVQRAIELGLVLRQAIDIVAGFTTSCTAGHGLTENGRAMRGVLETISESDSLNWTFYNLSESILNQSVTEHQVTDGVRAPQSA